MTDIITKLFFLICIVQGGTQNVVINYKESLTATVGQNISLPCIVLEKYQIRISQMEWSKADHKLVVYNPAFPVFYGADVKLELINRTDDAKLRGSILHLNKVNKDHTGDYVCDIATFPNGSIKRITSVQVMDPKVRMEVVVSSGILLEMDVVNIKCVSDPPADSYRIRSSQISLSLTSQNGEFTITNVTQHIGDVICQPFWSSLDQQLEDLKFTKQLSVDFLDNIECNSSSQITINTGTNLKITCEAKSSKPLHYVWKKGTLVVSSDVSLSLWSVNTSYSGIYTLTVIARNTSQLQRQKKFTVTVLDRTYTEHMETSQSSRVTMTTAKPGTTVMTSQSGHVSSTAYSTSSVKGPYIKTTAPPAGNTTTLLANVTVLRSNTTNTTTTSADSSKEGCCMNATSNPVTPHRRFTHAHANTSTVTSSFVSMPAYTTPAKQSKESHVVYILMPLLILLALVGFLYRRYIIQKRMDMPPPFKPPPPPVKYTSVRDNNVMMTDILV